jgi:hypothetical protein
MKKRPLKSYSAAVLLIALVFGAGSPSAFAERVDAEQTRPDAIELTIPLSLDFVIDPFEIAGRGQVYSDAPPIENRGPGDVLFEVTRVNIEYAGETNFIPTDAPFKTGFNDSEKRIYLELRLGGSVAAITGGASGIPPVPLGGAGSENAICSIGLSGNVNPYPKKDWRDGDVKITLHYQITALDQTETEPAEGEQTNAPPEDSAAPVSAALAEHETANETLRDGGDADSSGGDVLLDSETPVDTAPVSDLEETALPAPAESSLPETGDPAESAAAAEIAGGGSGADEPDDEAAAGAEQPEPILPAPEKAEIAEE